MFVELVFAPGYDEDALEVLQPKENVRILEDDERRRPAVTEQDLKRVRGGMLIQDRDIGPEMRDEMQVVTERKPTEEEWGELLFAWKVCKHVRSNAIVLARDLGTAGIGAGQMSRVDSVRIAIEKAAARGSRWTGPSMASDAFFPFADGPAGGDRRRRADDHPARRIPARPRGRGRLRRRGRGDGLHRTPPLPALNTVH